MPANQGATRPDWAPQPDIRPHNFDSTPIQYDYIPRTFNDCVRYIIECANIPDVDIYAGLPDAQQAIAEDIATEIYRPKQSVVVGLKKWFEQKEEVIPSSATKLLPSDGPSPFVLQNRKPKSSAIIVTRYPAVKTHLQAVPEPSSQLARLRRSRVSA